MTKVLFAAALLCLLRGAAAHDAITTNITWTREISRIVNRRCAACHQAGGRAPMPLLTYEQARPWAVAIKEEVLSRQMPPWPAVKGFGDFANGVGLTEDDILTIANWVEGGAPEGDAALLPKRKPVPQWKPASLPKGRITRDPGTAAILAVRAKRPGKIVARLPDGRTVPLAWTIRQRVLPNQWLLYRQPVVLPKDARIEGQAEFLTAAPKPSP